MPPRCCCTRPPGGSTPRHPPPPRAGGPGRPAGGRRGPGRARPQPRRRSRRWRTPSSSARTRCRYSALRASCATTRWKSNCANCARWGCCSAARMRHARMPWAWAARPPMRRHGRRSPFSPTLRREPEMDFSISATDRQRLQTLRRLGREEMRPAGWRADRAAAPLPVDDPFFARMLAQGFGRTRWRPAGADSADSADAAAPNKAASAVAQVLLAEEGAYWDRGIGVALPGPGLGEPPLLALGTPGQEERFLAPFVAPQRPIWGAFAMTEPSGGSDVANIKTRARRDGDHWVLNGAKSFSGNSGRPEWIVVFATIDPALGRAGHRAFVVERGTPGLGDFRVEKKMGLRAYESTSFLLSDCRVPMANLLGGEAGHGQPTGGFKGAMNTFNAGRPAIAGMAVGMGRAALDEAMACMCEAGLASEQPLRAAWLADQRQPNMLEASAAKALAPPAAFEAASFAMEVLGAAGGRGDHLIEKLFRDVKALDIVEGTGQIQRVVMARHLV